MRHWDLREIEAPGGTRSPVVLTSAEAARAVLVRIDAGQELGDHQVKETAFLVVIEGNVRVEAGVEGFDAGEGTLLAFEPDERRAVSSATGARVLLVLAPWPGEGHYRGDEGPAPTD